MPFFSVVIPLYNKEHIVSKTIKSALNQTFTDFEIIVVNDGSTDESINKVEAINDKRVTLFTIENQGVSYARNYGIHHSNGKYICFLDADDLWYSNHLEDLKGLIQDYPNCGLYCKSYKKSFFGKTELNCTFHDLRNDFSGIIPDYFLNSLVDEIAWTSAVAISRNKIKNYNGFDITLKSGQDTDLWIRIALNKKIAFSSKVSAVKVISEDGNHLSLSNKRIDRVNLLNKYKSFENEKPSFKKYMDLNRFSIAIERKIENDAIWKAIIKDIDYNNLNIKQKILIKLPKNTLVLLKQFQNFLLKQNIHLTPFK